MDVIVISVVWKVCATNGKVSKVVGRGGSSKVAVQPIVDAVVILVKGSANIVVEVVVVIKFTINHSIAISVPTGNLEDSR